MVVVLLFNSYATRSGKGEIFFEKYRRGKNQQSVCGRTNYMAVEKNRSLFWFLLPPPDTQYPTKPVRIKHNKIYQ